MKEPRIGTRKAASAARRLMRVARAAEFMGVSRSWFYARTGYPFMHHGRRGWRVNLAALLIPAVELWLAEVVRAPAPGR
jgi:hypothetical protein